MNIVYFLPWTVLSALLVLAATISLEATCGANHTKLLLLADVRHDTNLTITRLKNIVSYFITKVKDGNIKTLDVCLVDPLQQKTLFNVTKVNASREITSVIDQLVKSNVSYEVDDELLDDRTQLFFAFEYSVKVFSKEIAAHKEHVVVILSSCRGICEELVDFPFHILSPNDISKIIILLEVRTKMDPHIYNKNYVSWYHEIGLNVVFIDSKDDFHSYNPVTFDHCRDCPDGWTQYIWSGNRISCYRKEILERAISWLNASRLCTSTKSSLPAIETEDELKFLVEHLLRNRTFKKARISLSEKTTIVVNVGLLKRIGLQQHHYMWYNLRPFNLEASFESSDDSRDRCVAVSFSFNALNRTDEFKWYIVNCDELISRILVCEMERRLSHDFFQRTDRIQTTAQIVARESWDLRTFLRYKLIEGWVMFYCHDDDENFLTYNLVCDGIRHCNNGIDEQYCNTISSTEKQSKHVCVNPNGVGDYPTRTSIPSEARCNVIQDCPDNSDEQGCDGCLGRQCHDRTCLPSHWLSRDRDYCHLFIGANRIVYLNVSYLCKNQCSGLVPFKYEIRFCNKNISFEHYSEGQTLNNNLSSGLEWSPKCLYLRGSDGSPTGCHNKYHLRDCSSFQCPEGFVKCPDSYCVPVYNLGDKIFDCPYGEDEDTRFRMFYLNYNIVRCWNSGTFIHKVHRCDGVPQCPYGEDETHCHVSCPPGFKCNGQAVEVGKHTLVPEIKSLNIFDIKTKFFNLTGIELSKLKDIFIFPNLLEIHASNCSLVDLRDIFVIEYENLFLYTANFSFNKLKVLPNFGPIASLNNLQFLNLSHNKQLSEIRYYSVMSKKLHTLDLSFTNISFLQMFILEKYNTLQYLNLYHSNIVKVGSLQRMKHLSFDFFNLQKTSISAEDMAKILKSVYVSSALYVDNYKYCCPQISTGGTPKHACHAPPEAFSSCEDLLSDSLKRSLLWLVAVVSLAGNIVVITYRLFYDRGVFKKGYGIFVTNLSVSDFVMGVYLLIIACTDVHHREEYVLYESVWRQSALCQTAGFLSTLSSETSTFFVFLITLDRCLVIRFPFGEHRFKKVGLVISVLFAWIFGLIFASVPLIYPEWIIYSSNGMCFGLPLRFRPHPGWYYSFSVFIGLNFILFLCITGGQIFIFLLISSNQSFQMNSAMIVARRVQDINIARQLFFVVLSNFLCWFPICVLGFLTLTGYEVSPDTYAWLVIFVMPLNSAVNPMIYTIPVMYTKWQDFKKGETNRTRRRVNKSRVLRQQSR